MIGGRRSFFLGGQGTAPWNGSEITVKAGKRTPQDSIIELIIWKMNPLVVLVSFVKSHEIQIGISACVMSSEYLTTTSLY